MTTSPRQRPKWRPTPSFPIAQTNRARLVRLRIAGRAAFAGPVRQANPAETDPPPPPPRRRRPAIARPGGGESGRGSGSRSRGRATRARPAESSGETDPSPFFFRRDSRFASSPRFAFASRPAATPPTPKKFRRGPSRDSASKRRRPASGRRAPAEISRREFPPQPNPTPPPRSRTRARTAPPAENPDCPEPSKSERFPFPSRFRTTPAGRLEFPSPAARRRRRRSTNQTSRPECKASRPAGPDREGTTGIFRSGPERPRTSEHPRPAGPARQAASSPPSGPDFGPDSDGSSDGSSPSISTPSITMSWTGTFW